MKRRSFLRSGALTLGGAVVTSAAPARAWGIVQPGEKYYRKMANFDDPDAEDVICLDEDYRLLKATLKRIRRVQSTVGYGNFNVLSFDHMLKVARSYRSVGSFTRPELEYLEKLFYLDASRYGFYGTKVLSNLSDDVDRKHAVKIQRTGQRIYQGRALEMYKLIERDIGPDVVLTSGVRSIVKQIYLFLNKAARSEGNLSLASRSLAPPGYSFHAVGDFDVGKRGLGGANFTDAFAETDVYRRLVDLGFAQIRYPKRNLLGVRFEPWHIRVL